MVEISLLSAFVIGLAGSTHCVGMCGGIVGAFSYLIPAGQAKWPYLLLYNTGRIVSYTVAGCLTGALGYLASQQSAYVITVLQFISGALLLLVGLYIANWWSVLARLEAAGKPVWQMLQPVSKRLLPLKSPWQALPFGMLWGWLPCGLVYSALTWSLASGSAVDGALIMLFFGLGTLPTLLLVGATAVNVKAWLQHKSVRQIIGALLSAYGLWLLWQSLQKLI